jgi:hypothetical protein
VLFSNRPIRGNLQRGNPGISRGGNRHPLGLITGRISISAGGPGEVAAMRHLTPHPGKQLLFALLSAADLVLTWWLLDHSGGLADEANPIARWWLLHYGWLGLACFKAALVLLVLLLTAVISPSRSRAAGRLLALGCAALGIVVAWSSTLCLRAPASGELTAAQLEENEDFKQKAREELRHRHTWRALLENVRDDLVAQRCTLTQAVGRLASPSQTRNHAWLQTLPIWPSSGSLEECLAVFLLSHLAIVLQHRQQTAWEVVLRLESEFHSRFGHPAPRTHRQFLRGRPPSAARLSVQ